MSAPAGIEKAAARWRDRAVVVVGAGRSGVAAAHLLLDCGARVTITDMRPAEALDGAAELEARGATLRAGGHPEELWGGADTAVFSPGIRPQAPVAAAARAAGVEIIAEIEVAAPFIGAPIIAITGSNGKSTVTSMVGAIMAAAGLRPAVCGNIGTALSSAVRRQRNEGIAWDVYVVEISSFQALGVDRFHPRLAALLNIQPDHIDWHGSLEAYAAAKLRLTRNMTAEDWLVYDHDDTWLRGHLPSGPLRPLPFSRHPAAPEPPAAWVGDSDIWWWPSGDEPRALLGLAELAVIGPHNEANACAAAALGALHGVSDAAIAAGLRDFRPLEHRMEECGRVGGVRCINDSKATNVDATLAALAGFESGVWLVLGGRDKGADFARLLPLLEGRVARVLLIGEASETIAAALEGSCPLQPCKTMERAVAEALEAAAPGDTLLLAPACTSFDQYANFEERGRHFKALVAHAASAVMTRPTENAHG